MKIYKRRISNEFYTTINDNGETELLPKTIRIFLTQTIKDLGIYEDANVAKRSVYPIDPGNLPNDDRK